jgi:hypothetical protein
MTELKHKSTIFQELGYCRQSKEGRVLEKNSKCIKICGNKLGAFCTDGCQKLRLDKKLMQIADRPIEIVPQKYFNPLEVSAVILNDGNSNITLLSNLTKLSKQHIDELKNFGLSKQELTIIRLRSLGHTNKEISNKLYITQSTVHTHLNNIYKKIPKSWRVWIKLLKN